MDGVVEGSDGDALVAAGEWVGRVDVTVASHAESGGVSLAGDVSRGLLADLADPDARVAGSELVGGMDLGVAAEAEEGGVGAAEEVSGGRFAGVTELGGHGEGEEEEEEGRFFSVGSKALCVMEGTVSIGD